MQNTEEGRKLRNISNGEDWIPTAQILLLKTEWIFQCQFMSYLFKIMLMLFFMGMTTFMQTSKGTVSIIF